MRKSRPTERKLTAISVGVFVLLVGLTTVGLIVGTGGLTIGSSIGDLDYRGAAGIQSSDEVNTTLEDEYVEPAPEYGDEYFEAASDEWVSYVNPRDDYRSPYLGDGSGKICTTLVNENGDPIVGESVPDTTVTISTGESLSWHSYADPMVVKYPLTEHYERPLDADQFGTSSEVPQGDGYMDSHCIELHGLSEDGDTVEYGEPEISGEYADWIEVVGYVEQEHEAWDTDVDPIADAKSYEETGGEWTYKPDGSHGQVVIVLQLDPPEDAYPEEDQSDGDDQDTDEQPVDDDTTDSTDVENTTDETTEGTTVNETDETDDGDDSTTDESKDSDETASTKTSSTESESRNGTHGMAPSQGADGSPGFGALVAIIALTVGALSRIHR